MTGPCKKGGGCRRGGVRGLCKAGGRGWRNLCLGTKLHLRLRLQRRGCPKNGLPVRRHCLRQAPKLTFSPGSGDYTGRWLRKEWKTHIWHLSVKSLEISGGTVTAQCGTGATKATLRQGGRISPSSRARHLRVSSDTWRTRQCGWRHSPTTG